MSIKNKILAAILAATLLISTTACADSSASGESLNKLIVDGEAVAVENIGTFGDTEIDFDLFAAFYLQNKTYYATETLTDPVVAEELKAFSLESTKSMYAIDNLFAEYDLVFTIEDEELLAQTIANSITQAGSEVAFNETLATSGISPELYEYLVKNSIYQEKLLEHIETTATQEDINAYIEENYVRAFHVLIQSEDKNDADKELAETVLGKAKAGEDFLSLVEQYGEDPGMVDNTEGYYFTYNEMVPEFETATFEMEVDEISDIVETTYGYHIIKKYPLEEEYITANLDTLASGYYIAKLNELIGIEIENNEFTPNEFYDMVTPETLP